MQRGLEFVRGVGGEFLADQRGLFKFFPVPGELFVLVVQTPQQRQDLFISFLVGVFKRRVQVQFIDGLDNPLGKAGGQKKRDRKEHRDTQGKRQDEMKEQSPDRRLRDGETKDRSVRESLGCVQLPLKQGRRIAAALSVTDLERLADLLPLQMVRHDMRIRLVVVQNGPVGSDPCDAEIRVSQPVKIVLSVEGNSLGDKLGFTPQLLELFICEVIVQKYRSETERYGQSGEKNEPDGTEYFAPHEMIPALSMLSEPVADSADSADSLAALAELGAQSADVYVHSPCLAGIILVPDRGEELVAGKYKAGVFQ